MHRLVKTLLALMLLPVLSGAQANPEKVAFVGARVIDGTGRAPIENGVVLIAGDRIQIVGKKATDGAGRLTIENALTLDAAGRIHTVTKEAAVLVPPGARMVDVTGKTLMPALVDLHTHLGQTLNGVDPAPDAYSEESLRAQLSRLLAYGIGTVGVMGTDRDLIYPLRDEERAGKFAGARFYTAGRGFGAKGGFPAGSGMSLDVYRPETPEAARAQGRELAAHHPDFVKMWVDDGYGRMPKMPPEIYGAIIDEAHRHDLRVLAHVYYLADAKGLLAAGVDALAHSVRDQPVDRDLIEAMKARNVIYVATLVRDESTFVYAAGPAWLGDAFFQAGLLPGVRIGFGTDAGPPGRFLGYFEHRELQLMVEAGLTPKQAIVCATHNAAEFLQCDFGTIEPGRRADILLLDGNPLVDIAATQKLVGVWQGGKLIKPIAAK